MQISRRNFLRTSTVRAAAGIAASSFSFPRLASAEPQRSLEPGGPILPNSIENPYGPWASVLESMRGVLSYANRYPVPHYNQVVNLIGEMHRVSPDQVIPGCG